jgi:hypothetical protein
VLREIGGRRETASGAISHPNPSRRDRCTPRNVCISLYINIAWYGLPWWLGSPDGTWCAGGLGQTRGMHTIIRNKHASKSDFVFYSNRLIRLVVEHSLGQLPFHEKVRRHTDWFDSSRANRGFGCGRTPSAADTSVAHHTRGRLVSLSVGTDGLGGEGWRST